MEKFEGKVQSNGLNIYVRYLPSGDKTPVVLVMGLGFQMTTWPPNLIGLLQESGYPVLLFDNRDVGLSEKISQNYQELLAISFLKYNFGFKLNSSYTLFDMANDTLGLFDYFKINQAHILGISMGGMIAQIVASMHPERIKSLTLLSTSDNSKENPIPSIETLWRMMGSGIGGNDLSSIKQRSLLLIRTIQSPGFSQRSDEILLKIIEKNYYRSYCPDGRLRQITQSFLQVL